MLTGVNIAFLKKSYKSYIHGNLNNTSLCLYHGPQYQAYGRGLINSSSMFFGRWWNPNRKRKYNTGTVLTGDQFLKTKMDFGAFMDYFANRMDKTEFFQVPHHGSLRNWNIMPNRLSRYFIRCYIINHGFGRPKHPDKKVIQNLKTYCSRAIVFNTEFSPFSYKIVPIK